MRSVARSHARSLYSAVVRAQYETLKVFPEFEESRNLAFKGEFAKAIPLMERVQDVVNSTMGESSMMSLAAALQLSDQRSRMAMWDEALLPLKTGFESSGRMYALLSEAAVYARKGAILEALQAAEEATALCEAQDQANMDVSAFAPCYGILGICRARSGDYDGAEEVLQMAARWSDDPHNILVSLNNLGSLQWSLGQSESATRSRDEHIHEALAYWQEAAEMVVQGLSDGNSAAAMCGPVSSSNMLGPDMQPTVVTPSSSSRSENSNAIEDEGITMSVEDRLRNDRDLASAYASTLCNIAKAQCLQGQEEVASENLAAALKAIEGHDNDYVLGRVLAEMARAHTRSMQAVSAEGLFRSAISKLSGPNASGEPRYALEAASVKMDYGKLLVEWDKREREGQKEIEQANKILENLTNDHFNEKQVPMVIIDGTWLMYT
jgi:tetratricopeptide (TPR) repeat protein